MNEQKVLLVDDDGPILKALHLRFQHAGFGVMCAKNAISAINVVQQERPGVVVLDINMPGADGFMLAERLAEVCDYALPVIFMSANKSPELMERARNCNAVNFYEKPFDSKELVAEVAGLLNGDDDETRAVG